MRTFLLCLLVGLVFVVGCGEDKPKGTPGSNLVVPENAPDMKKKAQAPRPEPMEFGVPENENK